MTGSIYVYGQFLRLQVLLDLKGLRLLTICFWHKEADRQELAKRPDDQDVMRPTPVNVGVDETSNERP